VAKLWWYFGSVTCDIQEWGEGEEEEGLLKALCGCEMGREAGGGRRE